MRMLAGRSSSDLPSTVGGLHCSVASVQLVRSRGVVRFPTVRWTRRPLGPGLVTGDVAFEGMHPAAAPSPAPPDVGVSSSLPQAAGAEQSEHGGDAAVGGFM